MLNKTELEASRKLIHLSINQMADFIGVQSRSLRRWEDGTHPITDFVQGKVQAWLDIYQKSVLELRQQAGIMQDKHGDDFTVALLIYKSQEDFALVAADTDIPFQLFNAVNTSVWHDIRPNAKLVAFDFEAYSSWLEHHGYADSRQFRSQWAALHAASPSSL